jgi:transketolase
MAEKKATRDAYGETILALGKGNENIVVFDADLSSATRTGKFAAAFPNRHFNAGIAEMNMAGMAAGMAACGKIPFISTFAVFGTGRIYDMVRDSICYPKLNVKLALTHAGLTVGEDGATHQSLEDIALMNVLPNMTVFVPADAPEAAQAIRAAAEIDGPVYIRLGRSKIDVIHDDSYRFVPGKIQVEASGTDVTIAACGIMVAKALEAKEILREQGIDAAVLNVSTIKPLDTKTIIDYAKKTGAIVTCEEHSVYGGLGSVIAKAVTEEYPVPIRQVAVMDTFGESGDAELLLVKYGLTAEEIVKKTLAVIKQKQLYHERT